MQKIYEERELLVIKILTYLLDLKTNFSSFPYLKFFYRNFNVFIKFKSY